MDIVKNSEINENNSFKDFKEKIKNTPRALCWVLEVDNLEDTVKKWAQIAYQGAKDQNDFVNGVVKEHGQNPQPDGLPAHCQMNPEGEAALRHSLDEGLKKCSELQDPQKREDCVKHYKKQISRLNKREDTDTFSVWMDKNGNLVCTKITNKQK